MKRGLALILLVAGAAMLGCIPSLHPIYTADDVVFDSALIGSWSEAESDMTWDFLAGGDSTYRLTLIDEDGRPGTFDVHLVRIGEGLFLDIFPRDLDGGMNKFYQMHFFPVHTFMRVYQVQPTLKLAMLNGRWLDDYLSEHPDSCGHEIVDNEIILTASTERLQAFLGSILETPQAFETPTEFKKLYRDK